MNIYEVIKTMNRKFLILIVVELLTSRAHSQTEDHNVVQHRVEKVTVHSIVPQLFLQVRQLTNELNAVQAEVNSLKSMEAKMNQLHSKMESLQDGCSCDLENLENDRMVSQEGQFRNRNTAFEALKKEIDILQQACIREKYYVRKLESVISGMNSSIIQELLRVDQQFSNAHAEIKPMEEKMYTVDKT